MLLSICASIVLLFTVMGRLAANPGMKIKITDKGLQYARKIGVNLLEQKIKEFQLPDETGKIDLMGWLDYKVSRLQLIDVGLPNSSAEFIPNIGIRFSTDVSVSLVGELEVSLGLLYSAGTFNLNISMLSATFVVGFLHNDGRPTVKPISCNSTLKDFEITFHGSSSWLHRMFIERTKGEIRKAFSKKVCSHFVSLIERLETMDQTALQQVDHYVAFDYSLVREPVITANSIEWPIKGIVYDRQHRKPPPYDVQPFNLPDITDLMLYVGVSEDVLNTMGFAYFVAGALQIDITDDKLPEDISLRLNTSNLSLLLPETASVGAQVYISEMRLRGSVHLKSFDLVLKQSKVGNIQVKALDTILTIVFKKNVLPKLNVSLYRGKALLILHKVSLPNAIIKINKGMLMLGTDLEYRG
ncbi:lipopolysaccharide-binding protein [Callorhinchus milii]|nr:lipopolysaccharide-binding protein [Callorhinchus milii]